MQIFFYSKAYFSFILTKPTEQIKNSKNWTNHTENNKEIFLSIPVLYNFLKSINMHYSVGSIAINITQGQRAGSYHMNSGPYNHSLNIPISGCENTWINFFQHFTRSE